MTADECFGSGDSRAKHLMWLEVRAQHNEKPVKPIQFLFRKLPAWDRAMVDRQRYVAVSRHLEAE